LEFRRVLFRSHRPQEAALQRNRPGLELRAIRFGAAPRSKLSGVQRGPATVAARRLQDRGETGRAVFKAAEGLRTGDWEKRDRKPLRPSSQTAVYRRLVWCLRNNYTFAAMDFGRRLGASDEHIPQWICKERATTPPPKRQAALWVALKLAWGVFAPSVEYRRGYTSSLAPRPRPT